MPKKIGECRSCGEIRPLMQNGLCGSCSGKRGGRPAREAAMADALATVLTAGPAEAAMILPKKPDKGFWSDMIDEGEKDESIEDDGEPLSLDSPVVLIGVAVLVLVCYALFGDQLREMISKVSSGLAVSLPKTEAPSNPYKVGV